MMFNQKRMPASARRYCIRRMLSECLIGQRFWSYFIAAQLKHTQWIVWAYAVVCVLVPSKCAKDANGMKPFEMRTHFGSAEKIFNC